MSRIHDGRSGDRLRYEGLCRTCHEVLVRVSGYKDRWWHEDGFGAVPGHVGEPWSASISVTYVIPEWP